MAKNDWKGKLHEYGEKLKAKEPGVIVLKPGEPKKPFKHHYYIVHGAYHKWDKVKKRFYRLSCSDRLYNKIPPNATKDVSLVTCVKCKKAIRG
jgi:hypothetical protein